MILIFVTHESPIHQSHNCACHEARLFARLTFQYNFSHLLFLSVRLLIFPTHQSHKSMVHAMRPARLTRSSNLNSHNSACHEAQLFDIGKQSTVLD